MTDHRYTAWVIRVIDGDTLIARIDLGLQLQALKTVRLAGVDAPERGTLAGRMAEDFTRRHLLHTFVELEIGSRTFDKYGRVLATVFQDGKSFNQALLDAGPAVPFEK